ncbi:MAG: hypothetical protein ACFCUI_10915 [Bernardetiaceae bacterium]
MNEQSNAQNHTFFKCFVVYLEWRKQVLSGSSPLELSLPWVTVLSKNYMVDFLVRRPAAKVFEYGSGGSTLFFLRYAEQVVTVEHDRTWFDKVKSLLEQHPKRSNWEGFLFEPEKINSMNAKPADPSNPGDYYTQDEQYADCVFEQYAKQIDAYPDDFFDLVLVDGRSRPACVQHSLPKIRTGGWLVVDNAEREYYKLNNLIKEEEFNLFLDHHGALISLPQYTQTNIYVKK